MGVSYGWTCLTWGYWRDWSYTYPQPNPWFIVYLSHESSAGNKTRRKYFTRQRRRLGKSLDYG